MSDVPSVTLNASPPSRPWGLWAICMTVVAGLLVAWAADRAKPLVIFPMILGAVFGGAASLAAVWCHLPRRRWAVAFIMVGAMAMMPVSYIRAAERLITSLTTSNPLAERLLKQVEQQAPDAVHSIPRDNAVKAYLRRRYRCADMTSVLCLIGESALAGMTAGVMMAVVWRGQNEEPQA